jgi:hypothetical protein
MVTPDGRVLNVRRNDLLDHDRPQNMRMEGDRDGGGGGKNPILKDVDSAREFSRAIPSKWKKHFKCKEYANALVSKLKAQKIKGELLEMKTGTGFIQSDEFGSIATNGVHQAVKVGDTVFDNLRPSGIKYKDWIEDLGGEIFTNPPHAKITSSPF